MPAAISYDPIVTFDVGPLEISPHGVGIAVGFLAGVWIFLPEAKRKGITEEQVYTIAIRAAIGSLIGTRLAYVLNHLPDYIDDPLDIFRLWEGGISLLGGIFGAIIACIPLVRKLRLNVWKGLDAAAPGVALGIIIGRIGDLVVADHLGKPTDFFLGYTCTGVDTASPCEAPIGEAVHQTALYDLILTCGLLALLLVLRRKPRWDGFIITVFGAWYATGRLIEDFLREDLRRFGLTGSQWTSVATLAVCAAWLLFVRRTPHWGHWDRLPPPDEAVPGDPGVLDGPDGEDRTESAGRAPTMAAAPVADEATERDRTESSEERP